MNFNFYKWLRFEKQNRNAIMAGTAYAPKRSVKIKNKRKGKIR